MLCKLLLLLELLLVMAGFLREPGGAVDCAFVFVLRFAHIVTGWFVCNEWSVVIKQIEIHLAVWAGRSWCAYAGSAGQNLCS